MFDTIHRASASGMLPKWILFRTHRRGGLVALIAGQKFIDEGTFGVRWLGAGGIWVSALRMCFLP